MAAQIVVNIENQPGSMARVVAALRRFGLSPSRHRIQSAGNGLSRLVLIADGPFSPGELIEKLGDVKGVRQVVSVAPANGATGAAPILARPTPLKDPEEDLVKSIVANYPRILHIIEKYEATLSSDRDRATRLKRLGQKVGARMLQNDESLFNSGSIHEALQTAVVPALIPISDAEAMGSEIRTSISIFTRRRVNTIRQIFGNTANRCDFMSGLIQGMINLSPSLPKVNVEEHACRTNGDDCCVFRVMA